MSGSSSPTPVAIRIRGAVNTRAGGPTNDEAGLDPQYLILENVDAVAGRLGPARGQELGRGHPVAGQEPLHVGGGRVPRRSSIDHGDPAAGPAQHQSPAQAGCSAADHHHVVGLRLHGDHLHRHPAPDTRI
jgi:hypothetical protein